MKRKTHKPSALELAAVEAFDLGYRPIPVTGKRPIDKGWSRYADETPELATFTGWGLTGATGFGLVMGSPAGDGNYVIAIDVDLRDYDDINDILGTLPTTMMSKKGEKGVTLFYRVPEELLKPRMYDRVLNGKRERMLDFLGKGRQTIMPPSEHPDEGVSYAYSPGASLLPPAKLPLLSEDDIVEMEEMLATLGWDRRYTNDGSKGAIRLAAKDGETIEGSMPWVNGQALGNIGAWIEDLNLYDGKWSGARYAAVSTLRGSSTGRPNSKRKRNLSVHPDGIRDFGSGDAYSPIDLVSAQLGITPQKSYVWLSERVNPNWAVENDADFSALLANIEAKQKAKFELGETTKLSAGPPNEDNTAGFVSLPQELIDRAPGYIREVAQHILRDKPDTPKGLALGAALAVMSQLTSRRFVVKTHAGPLPLTLFIWGIASTAAGKDYPRKFINNLFSEMADREPEVARIPNYGTPSARLATKGTGCAPVAPQSTDCDNAMRLAAINMSHMTGSSAITSMLYRTATPLISVDEIGQYLPAWHAPQQGHEPIAAVMKEIFYHEKARSQKQFAYDKNESDENSVLRAQLLRYPSPTIYGTGTLERISQALTQSMVTDGFINRHIILFGEKPRMPTLASHLASRQTPSSVGEIDPHLIDRGIEIYTFSAKSGIGADPDMPLVRHYENTLDNRTDVFAKPDLIEVGNDLQSDGWELWSDFEFHQLNDPKDGGETPLALQPVCSRVAEIAVRIAALAAIAEADLTTVGSITISKNNFAWAIDVMRVSRQNIIKLATDHIGGASQRSENMSVRERALRKKYREVIEAKREGRPIKRIAVYDSSFVNKSNLLRAMDSRLKSEYLGAMDVMLRAGDCNIVMKKTPAGRDAEAIQIISEFEEDGN